MIVKKPIIGIMAATKDGVIGRNKDLPWHYPSETEHFKNTVKGNVVIMGHSSYECFPKSIEFAHQPIIFSRNPNLLIDETIVVHSIDECLKHIEPFSQKIFMIGGAQITALFLQHNLISSLILTNINKDYYGDTRIDLDAFKHWHKTTLQSRDEYSIVELVNPDF